MREMDFGNHFIVITLNLYKRHTNAERVKSIQLKNDANAQALVDDDVYQFLSTDKYYVKLNFLQKLRKHSSGCVFFQRSYKIGEGQYKSETIYLHRLVAELFLSKKKGDSHDLVSFKNKNKLDCQKENLVWRSRAEASRLRKVKSKTGYMGVYHENQKFRAVISYQGKSIHIGMFNNLYEAAKAYNRKSWELYGHMGIQNKIPKEFR